MSELFDKVLSKRDLWAVISISVFLASFLPVPENNFEYFITRVIALSVVLSFILGKICNVENIWKLLFLRQLADIELHNRKFTSNPLFIDFPKDSQEEITKIDNHIKDFFAEFTELSILSLINLLIFILLIIRIIPLASITALDLNFNNSDLIFVILILNCLFLYNASSQIKKDFLLYRQIYEKYGDIERLSVNKL